MARGKRRPTRLTSAQASPLDIMGRKTQTQAVKPLRGRHPSANFFPYQESEIVELADIVASEEHRSLLELDIRAATGHVTSLRWDKEMSGTDMKGGVFIRNYEKEAKKGKYDPIDRAICIEGNEEHEKLHCVVSDPYVFSKLTKDLKKKSKQGKDEAIMAMQLKHLWNLCEDGMIETYSCNSHSGRYPYLLGLAALDPCIGSVSEQEKKQAYPAPKEGYVPTDASGKPLSQNAEGEYVVSKGQEISIWGLTPLGLPAQMIQAAHAYSLPEYEVGPLHPNVQACFDECQPYLDAARTGNSADCADAAFNLYAIIKKHDLLPEIKIIDGGGSMVMGPGGIPMPGGMGSSVSAPSGMQFAMGGDDDDDSSDDEKGAKPKNPMPSADGKPEMGEELSDQLGGGGKEGKEGEEDDKKGTGSGGGKEGEEEDDKKDQKAGGGKGDKEEGDDDADKKDGDKDSKDGKDGKSPSDTPYGPGGASGSGGFDPNTPIPQTSNRPAQEAIEDVRKKMKAALDQAVQDTNAASQNIGHRAGSVRWKTPQKLYRKEEMRQGSVRKALADEGGKFTYTGKALAEKFRRIKEEYEEDQTNLQYGRLDRRKLTRAVAGQTRIMKQVRVNEAGKIAIDVVFDLSGSTNGDREDQYRAGMMFALAGQQARIPVSLYGGDESHYEFKRPDERDISGLSCIFGAGGGGTPAAPWIEFQRARLGLSSAAHKWAFVITDGASFDPGEVRQQIQEANKEGIAVFGLTYGCDPSSMDRQFGSGNWAEIDEYTQAPAIAWRLIEKTLKSRLGV